jgi:YbbR domain-containing protein
MAKKLTNNLGLKILAVLIASLLWLIAININDPVGQQTYTVNVQMVNLSKLTDNNKYVEVLEGSDTIRVTVRAARSVLSELSDKNISAIADVDKLTEGNYIPIELSCTKNSVDTDDLKADKDYLRVSVENIKRRQLPISVDVQGTPAENYLLNSTSTAQNAVSISGPESVVNTVNTVSVEIDITNANSDVNISLPIHLYDSDGKEIIDKRISKNISDVQTTASIWLIKGVPIEYGYTGVPADGYEVDGNLTSTISYINIAGKQSLLKNIQKIDINDAIDITGATRNIEEEIDIKKFLPDGVIIPDSNTETRTTLSLHISQIREEEEEEQEDE